MASTKAGSSSSLAAVMIAAMSIVSCGSSNSDKGGGPGTEGGTEGGTDGSSQNEDSGGIPDAGTAEAEGGSSKDSGTDSSTADAATKDGGPGPVMANLLSAGGTLACGISSTGVLSCWGDGIGSPQTVVPGTSWSSIAVADSPTSSPYYLACGIRTADSSIQCFSDTTWTPAQQDTGTFKSVTVGLGNQCAIATNGALYCWGQNNYYGQLGTGDTSPHSGLTRVGTDSDWTRVTATSDHACGIRAGGALYCWGYDYMGELGDGPGSDAGEALGPIAIAAGSTWLDVDASTIATCGVRSDGVLLCWGRSSYPPYYNYNVPTQIDSATDWAKVRLSSDHACALKTGGSIYCWGSNASGELGNGTLVSATSPQRMGTGTNWGDVAVGTSFSCGATTAGAVSCWGANNAGQLGQGTGAHTSPTQIGAAGAWSNVAAYGTTVCAVGSNGTLWCWGNSDSGALFGPQAAYQTPFQIGTGTSWASVSVGSGDACARQTNGAISCWGSGSSGELGLGSATTQAPMPTSVGLSATWVSATSQDTYAITSTGLLYGWGYNFWNNLASGSNSDLYVPTQLSAATWIAAVGDTNPGDTCAITTDHTLWCWGFWFNSPSQECFAGNGGTCTTQDQNWSAITAAESGAFLGLNHGMLYTWSSNPSFTQVGSDIDWASIAAGESHECGIRTDGSLGCIGSNTDGQLGNGTTTSSTSVAVQVGSFTDWTSVATGANTTCAVRANTLYCWGDNTDGAIGDGSAYSTTPVNVQ